MANSKLLIRAVLMNDFKALQSILEEAGRHCWVSYELLIIMYLSTYVYYLLSSLFQTKWQCPKLRSTSNFFRLNHGNFDMFNNWGGCDPDL